MLNDGGGRGRDRGVLVFDCPLCQDSRGRGWASAPGFVVGCFNAGCVANGRDDRLEGGAVEFVRLLEGLRSRGEAWAFLHREYPRRSWRRSVQAVEYQDFVRYPKDVRWLWSAASPIMHEAMVFARHQWGVSGSDLQRWGVGLCVSGRYAWRLVIPLVMGARPVGFQARTFRNGEPKYLFARSGPPNDSSAECGRPASACLFNYDVVREGEDLVLVEGAGDVMGWSERGDGTPTIALLGQAMTPEKLALIAAKRPRRAVVALDAGAAERRRALDHVADLEAWGVSATIGAWEGAKDAGAGARLVILESASTLPGRVAAKVGRA